MTITIAGTGHRPDKLWGYNLSQPMYNRLRTALVSYIVAQSKSSDVVVISGMALGFDTVLAQATLIAKQSNPSIKLHCAIPCANHCAKWIGESITEWNRIVSLADIVHYVSDKPYSNSCMQKRNEYMVNNCDILLALWDGTAGGTANCVNYAIRNNKKILRLKKQ